MAPLTKVPLWLDSDPGHDDALAIILAAEHESLDLLGISSVHGNASLEKTTKNTLSVLTAIGRTDIKVFAGTAKPFCRPAVHASDIHGETGLEGTNLLPEPSADAHAQNKNAIVAMRDALMQTAPLTASVVATGTLTNVALLFAAFPEVAAHIKWLSIMGGAFVKVKGNITPYAEFNIYCDPEAATSIFSLPTLSHKIRLIPLDLTHGVLATRPILDALLTSEPTLFRTMLHELMTFFSKTYAEVFNITAGPPTHDPIAVAAILPETELKLLEFEWEEGYVQVTCSGTEIGRTVLVGEEKGEGATIEMGNEGLRIANVKTFVGKSCNSDAFWNLMMAAIEKSNAKSPLNT